MTRLRPLALLLGALLHLLALWLLSRDTALAWTLLAHVLGALVWGWGATLFLPLTSAPAWWFLAAPALLFPVIGPVTSLALARILRRPPVDRSAQRYVIWSEATQAVAIEHLPAGAAGQSIVEILQSPRTQLRRNAILALRDLDPSLAIPLLRKGLQDSDEQVRIYAQNILSTMLERFETALKELQQRLDSEPAAAAPAVRLAEQYYELVYLDVAGDDETAAHYLGQALALLDRAAAVAPADAELAYLGLKYALRARDAATARRWLARLETRTIETQQTLPWRMELAFLEGDWAALRELFDTFTRARHVNPRIEELIRFWNPPPAAA